MFYVTFGPLYFNAQGSVPVLLGNYLGMSCSETCWLLGGAWWNFRNKFLFFSQFSLSFCLTYTHTHTEIYTHSRMYLVCMHICVCIGEGNGNPLQYSCLENLMDGGAW